MLLAIDAIRSTRNDKPLHQDRTLLVQVLLGYQGIDIDKKGKYIAFSGQLEDGSPLLLAAKSCFWGIVCELVDKNAQLTMNSTLGGEKARSLEELELLQDPEAQEVYPQLLKKLRV